MSTLVSGAIDRPNNAKVSEEYSAGIESLNYQAIVRTLTGVKPSVPRTTLNRCAGPPNLSVRLRIGRVATGDCSPAAPTDPDVPDSGIRLLGLWRRCATVNTVNYTRWGERIALGQTDKLLPRHPGMPGATIEPLAP